ncbi:hypothetical protein A0U90_05860 [Kozakia baliensis]|nr:hypothetical protein A0U90_05860 [Kozakia baliensis]
MPRFADHYQPRVPRDLGHYTLDDPAVLSRQAKMAREAGIEGFVFYFYWFNGSRLLDSPLEMLLSHPEINLPFCLMWANENWSRRWDGGDDDILIAQDYRAEDDDALIACFARHMADPRYIRVGDRPLLMVYRPGAIPDAESSILRWRALFKEKHQIDPIFVMGQAFGDSDPRQFGMDGAIEFPPHKLVADCPLINDRVHILDDDLTAQIYDYADIVKNAFSMEPVDFPLIRTAAPSWDNDARRQGHGLVLHGSTPPLYEHWVAGLVDQARKNPFFGDPIICINAWNEWAEGAYLEPDQHYGSAYLNATGRAATGFERGIGDGRILLVGHDAFPSGAQTLLLAIGKQLRTRHGTQILFVLLEGGAMLEDYRSFAQVEILPPGQKATRERLAVLYREGFTTALVNSAASSALAPDLHDVGIAFTLLQHELPNLLRQRGLLAPLKEARALARETIVPSVVLTPTLTSESTPIILPQGLYSPIAFSAQTRRQMRARLGLNAHDRLVVGVGYADMRKGFDLFLQLWQRLQSPTAMRSHHAVPVTHFLWLGDIDPGLREGLQLDIDYAISCGTFHMPGRIKDIAPYLCAADVFALTSREDPYPSVALEALACGLPCCAFAGTGGIPELLTQINQDGVIEHGVSSLGDLSSMARLIAVAARKSLARPDAERRKVSRAMAGRFSFSDYVSALHGYLLPDLPRISIVVPSYNYGQYLASRLASIFSQQLPVFEIIVLDDASDDDSIAIAERTSAECRRDIRIIGARQRSGSVFRQWHKAVDLARGDWIWIAEADDLSEPAQLSTLFDALRQAPNAVMAFCDSRSIDEQGVTLANSYKPYCAESCGNLLNADGCYSGQEFIRRALSERNLVLNVSSAVFARKPLQAALRRCAHELKAFSIAGDWRLYVELLDQPDAELVYVAEPLNIHRRHSQSATHRLDLQKHLAEIIAVQDEIAKRFGNPCEMRDRQHAYRRTLIRQFGLAPQPVVAVERELALTSP